MSVSAKTKHDMSVGMDRIGLDFIRRDSQKNSLLLTVNSYLSAGCLALLSEKEERDGLLKWIGVDPETSDDVLVECFKCLVDTVKRYSTNKLFLQVACKPEVIHGNSRFDMLEAIGIPVVATEFPSPGASLINKAVEEATAGKIKGLVEDEKTKKGRGTVSPIVFASTFYFHGVWANPLPGYNSELKWELPCKPRQFHSMGGKGTFKFGLAGDYQYLALPVQESTKVMMEVFMTLYPSKLPVDLTVDDMAALREAAEPISTPVLMPYTSSKVRVDFPELLRDSGVVFRDKTLGKRARLIQQAEIGFGSFSAESVTHPKMEYQWEVLYPPQYTPKCPMLVNRPFVYTIRCGLVTLFMGYIYEPRWFGS